MAVVTLAPRGALHVGEAVGIERQRVLTYVPSDTLFAALLTAWAQLGRAEEMLAHLQGTRPPLTLTSAFPCLYTANEQGRPQATLRFYPRPMVRINASDENKAKVGKKLTRAAWISDTLFHRLCQGEDVTNACQDDFFGPGGLWLDPADASRLDDDRRDPQGNLRPLWQVDVVPRVALDRVTNASTLYHTGRVLFARQVGLWFGLRLAADGLEAPLRQALDTLADAGLGGLRSVGHGAFRWGWQEKDLPRADQTDYAVTLARYAPRDAGEITHTLRVERSAYKLVTVGGWCVDDHGHPWQRQRARLIAEGSVIGHHSQPAGWMVPVTPRKPKGWQQDATPWPFGENGRGRQVYRWGYAFLLPVAEAALPSEANHV